MARTFRPHQPDQLFLLPPSLKEWLPPKQMVYFASDLVETLDLTAIYESYGEEQGFPPYHPLPMTKAVLCGYCLEVRSSRRLEWATKEDVAFRVLGAGNEPDFRTISAFRARTWTL